MNTEQIIAELDEQIGRLKQAKAILTGEVVESAPGRPTGSAATVAGKHKISPEGRARIVAAVKARWAKQKKAAK
jgi:hypothetical protein